MYKVITRCNEEVVKIMETDKMTSRDVYKSALADIKGMSHIEKSSDYDRYEAYVYKGGKLLYLLALGDYRYLSAKWMGITRESDLETCVMRSFNLK